MTDEQEKPAEIVPGAIVPGMPAEFDPSKLMDMIPGIDPEMIDKGLEAMKNFEEWGKKLEWAENAVKSLAAQNIKIMDRLDKLESE